MILSAAQRTQKKTKNRQKIKRQKTKERQGEVIHDQCHGNVFPFFPLLLKWTFTLRTETSNKPQEEGKALKAKAAAPTRNNPQGEALTGRLRPWTPSLQHNHHTCYCGLQQSPGMAQICTPPPPPLFLSLSLNPSHLQS